MARNLPAEGKAEFQRQLRLKRLDYRAGLMSRDIIVNRTDNLGRDRNARFFAAYAETTLKRKRRKGQQTRPNLKDTGETMDLAVRQMPARGNTQYSVVMPPTKRGRFLLSIHIEGRGRVPVRDPMGLTRAEIARVDQRIIKRGVSEIRLTRRTEKATLTIKLKG